MTGPELTRPDGATRPAARVPEPRPARRRRTVPSAPAMVRADQRWSSGPSREPVRSGPPGREAPSALDHRASRWRLALAVGVVCSLLATGISVSVLTWLDDDPAAQGPPVALDPRDPQGSPRADVARRVLPSVVSVQVRLGGRTANGSGFVLDGRRVVTNAHVVGDDAADVRVRFRGGRSFEARVLGLSEGDDLAVLRVRVPAQVEPLRLASSSRTVSVGDDVIAVGSPLGLAGTVTAGIISATDREVRIGGSPATALQTDASINPGNSGGPLIDTQGRVVGVNTSIASLGGGNIGIGFAIPSDRVARVVDRLSRP